jgi:hypothetical protein
MINPDASAGTVGSASGCRLEVIELGALRLGRLDQVRKPISSPLGEPSCRRIARAAEAAAAGTHPPHHAWTAHHARSQNAWPRAIGRDQHRPKSCSHGALSDLRNLHIVPVFAEDPFPKPSDIVCHTASSRDWRTTGPALGRSIIAHGVGQFDLDQCARAVLTFILHDVERRRVRCQPHAITTGRFSRLGEIGK